MATADCNMLFGVVALQMDFVTRDQLIEAMNAWILNKSRSLGEILRSQGAIQPDELQLLEALVAKHLAKHGGDAEKSLQAISSAQPIVQGLQQLQDPDVQQSLRHLGVAKPAPPYDPLATQAVTLGQITAQGTRFRILRPHAKGGLGEVFLAQDGELNREVALKQIQQHSADHPDSRQRFLVEAEVTGGLEHPGIVPVYGLGTYADGRPFYAMKFIEGDSLQEAVDRYHQHRRKLNPSDASLEMRKLLARFIDVCDAMAYAHARGVLHRDLKPGNIMLGRFGETLVVDWGLAKPISTPPSVTKVSVERPLKLMYLESSTPTMMGSVVGTAAYMSPEQASGRLDELGPAADIYSLGATLYYVLTGQAPYTGANVESVLQRVRRGEFLPPRNVNENVPRPLDAICRKAMALLPNDRYLTALELSADIEHFLADEPVSAWQEPWQLRLRRWIRRHQTLVTSSAAVAGAVLVTLGIATALLNAAWHSERVARGEALRNAERAEKERAQAEANQALYQSAFEQARSAVERYFVRVSEETLLEQPGMQPLRRDLLREALDYYDRFLKERQGDLALQEEYATALFRRGLILEQTETLDSSRSPLAEARVLLERLVAEAPDARRLATLADVANAQGRIAFRLGQLDEAAQAFEAARDIRAPLAKPGASPEQLPQQQRKLANSWMNLGLIAERRMDFTTARQHFEQAQRIRQAALEVHEDALLERDLGKGFYNLSVLEIHTQRLPSAIANLRNAAQSFEAVMRSNPRDFASQFDLATCYNLLGDLLRNVNIEESRETQLQARDILERIAALNPEVYEYQHALGRAEMSLADIDFQANSAASREAFERATRAFEKTLSNGGATSDAQRDLTVALLRLTRLQLAVEQRDEAFRSLERATQLLDYVTGGDDTLQQPLREELEQLKKQLTTTNLIPAADTQGR